jgi:hypothetical protein
MTLWSRGRMISTWSWRRRAGQWCYETGVRVHRAGKHAACTGLKPAGLDVGR